MIRFPNLMSPLQVNHVTYRNRVMCAPMVFGTAVVGNEYDNARFAPGKYNKVEAPARGGCAVVSVGEINVNNREAKRMPLPEVDFTITSGEAFNAISEYAWRIKRHGAVAMMELCHPGAIKPPIPGTPNAWGPVGYTMPDGTVVEGMDEDMMESVCRDFALSTSYMKRAGFDGVVIHAGHGFIFTQYLSLRTNPRKDKYGGSLVNRARFPIQILERIRSAVGPEFLIELRLSGSEKVPNGMEVDEVGQFCRMVEGIVDTVHISAGLYHLQDNRTRVSQGIYTPHGYNAKLSAAVKRYTSLPVGVVGSINSPELAEQIIADGMADYVVLGRQMIADPEFANKVKAGREKEIRRCVGCFTCSVPLPDSDAEPWNDGLQPWLRVGTCAINPMANTAYTIDEMPRVQSQKKVLIVGGGPAGMQAAVTACDRGHVVTLVERSDSLGGALRFTDADTDKVDLRNFKDLLCYEVERRSALIRVYLNTEVDAELLGRENPDVLMLAIGAAPQSPPIPGIERAVHAADIYEPGCTDAVGKNVVIVGGGLLGCETAVHLVKTGHRVTVVDALPRVAHEISGRYRATLVDEMAHRGVRTLVKCKCTEIGESGVRIEREDGTAQEIPADTVVQALGMTSNDTAALEKLAKGIQIVKLGDCKQVGKVKEAIHNGFFAAMDII